MGLIYEDRKTMKWPLSPLPSSPRRRHPWSAGWEYSYEEEYLPDEPIGTPSRYGLGYRIGHNMIDASTKSCFDSICINKVKDRFQHFAFQFIVLNLAVRYRAETELRRQHNWLSMNCHWLGLAIGRMEFNCAHLPVFYCLHFLSSQSIPVLIVKHDRLLYFTWLQC